MTSLNHDDVQSSPPELQRKLSNRHLQLIAIGGAIGTGLFMGSGKTIALAGPSILFIYMIIGLMFFFLMRALGEILLSNLHYKSFIDNWTWCGVLYRLVVLARLGSGRYCRSGGNYQLFRFLAATRCRVYPHRAGADQCGLCAVCTGIEFADGKTVRRD